MKTAHKYISIMDYNTVLGCLLRLPKIRYGKYIHYRGPTRSFPLSAYRSKAACLKAAIKCRDEYLTKHKSMYLLKGPKKNEARRGPVKHSIRNTTGVIGLTITTSYKISGEYSSMVAIWSSPTGKIKQHRKCFSINAYGEKEAFLMACRVRYKHCGTLIVTDDEAIPCIPDVPYILED